MSAVLQFPVLARLQQDLQRMGLAGADTSNVAILHDAMVKRTREESERKFRDRYGDDFTPPEAA